MISRPIAKRGLTRRDFTKAAAGSAALGAMAGGASLALAQQMKGTFWFNQAFQMDNFQKVVERFRTMQDKADLDFVLVPQNQIGTKLATAVAGGEIPSAARLGGPELNALFMDRGQAMALDDLAPDIASLDWIPAIREAVTRDGKMYAMPVNSGALCFIYNRDLYEAKGLDPDSPPKTLHELGEVAAKISDPDTQTWGHYLLTAPDTQSGGQWFQHILWAFGGELLSEDGKTITLNSPEGVEAMEWYRWMVRDQKSMPIKQATEAQGLSDFLTGKVGSIFAFPSVLARVANASFKAQTAARPRGPKSATVPVGFGSIMVFKNSATWEAGWEFAKFIGLDADNDAFWNVAFGQLPPRYSYRQSPVWQEYQQKQPLVQAFLDAQEDARLTYSGPGASEIAKRVAEGIEAVVFGRQTPKEAIEGAATDAQVVLDRVLRRRG
jgi:ABC-type glycerol-3-phosphate transport system substrate-binding protein